MEAGGHGGIAKGLSTDGALTFSLNSGLSFIDLQGDLYKCRGHLLLRSYSVPLGAGSCLSSLLPVCLGATLQAEFHSSNALCTWRFLLCRVFSPSLPRPSHSWSSFSFLLNITLATLLPPEALMANTVSLFPVRWSFHCVTVCSVRVGRELCPS